MTLFTRQNIGQSQRHQGVSVRKALITAAGGLALALALSACGGVGDGKYQDADSLVRAATASTEKVKSRSEEHTSELQSRENLVCRLLLEKKKHKTLR